MRYLHYWLSGVAGEAEIIFRVDITNQSCRESVRLVLTLSSLLPFLRVITLLLFLFIEQGLL